MVHFFSALLPRRIRRKLEKHSDFHAIACNTGWLYFDNIFRATVGLIIGAWMARSLGPANLGALNYAIAFVALFWSAATLGVDAILIRELIRIPEEEQYLLGAAFYLKIIGCIISFALALFSIFLIRPGDTASITMVTIIAVGKLFTPLETIDVWFRSHLKSRLPVIAKNVAFLCASLVRIALLIYSAETWAFAWVLSLECVLNGICLIAVYRKSGFSFWTWRIKVETIRRLLKDSWPLLLTNITVVINLNIDKIILRELLGNEALGIYSAAVRISESWYFIPMALGASVYPALAKTRNTDGPLYRIRSRQFYDVTALLCIAIAILTTLLSTWIVHLLYGANYASCAPVLMIHVWSGLFLFLASASGRNLNLENKNHIVLYRGVIGAAANIAFNYLLIPYYGVKGAAISSVLSYGALVCSLGLFPHSRALVKPLFQAIFMVNFCRAVIQWLRGEKK